jgi:hypothetical protein
MIAMPPETEQLARLLSLKRGTTPEEANPTKSSTMTSTG